MEEVFKANERWVRAPYLRGEDGGLEDDGVSVYLPVTVLGPSDSKVI